MSITTGNPNMYKCKKYPQHDMMFHHIFRDVHVKQAI